MRALLKRLRSEAAPTQEAPGPIARCVERLLTDAIERRASDVHIDPAADGTRIRVRVDGFFEPGLPVEPGLHERLMARLKVLAGLAVYRSGAIQEGAIRLDDRIDLRLSIVPTIGGEKATLRIFDPDVRPFRLDELGFPAGIEAELQELADHAQGALLVAGPAGAGKTTTLYALLSRIAEVRGASQNICSVEDPVEYALPGVHQVPVSRDSGTTFARALSALLRQDPGVLLVGEIRDPETAAIAIEAGMTGHFVLSSIHAGSAAEALTRAVDLGVEPFLVASAVRAVVAQRLVRRVCSHCAVEDDNAPRLIERLAVSGPGRWLRGQGCERCRHSGFAGRVPLAELLRVDRDVAGAVLRRAGTHATGATHLLAEGIARARSGATTLAEVARVVGAEEPR